MGYMLPGAAFTGYTGTVYSATAQLVAPGDMNLAVRNGWTMDDTGPTGICAVTLPSGTTNNLEPVGFGTGTQRLEITANSSGSTLTGLQAGEDGQTIMIVNIAASGSLTIDEQSSSSTAANRFLSNANATVAAAGGSVIAQYSAPQQRWIIR